MEENVEIVRRFVEAVKAYWTHRGEWDATLGRFYDRDVDYYPVRKFPDSKPRHGVGEVRAFYDVYWEAWGTFDFEVLGLEPVGDDRVLVHMRLSGSGRGSGMDMGGELYAGYWIRNGRIFRHEDHLTEGGARRGLGIDG